MNTEAIVIGNEQISIECIKYLIVNNIKIIAVVSDSFEVLAWCKHKKLDCLEFEQLQRGQYNGVLIFSIINYNKIPEIITKNNLVINFHNSLLPRYAGLNATSWALINREKVHGISWHKVSNTIDAGEILFQSEIIIETNETALSLNLKCIEHAILGFKAVIQNLLQNKLDFTPQDLSQRTYFGAGKIIPNYGFIDPSFTFTEVEVLHRALDVGSRSLNRLGTLKLLCNQQVIILADLSKNSASQCEISLTDESIYSNTILDIYGNLTKISKLTDISTPVFYPEDLALLGQIQTQEYSNYNRLLKLSKNNNELFIELTTNPVTEQLRLELITPIKPETFIALAKLILAHFYLEDNLLTVYLPALANSSALIDSLVDSLAIVKLKKSELDLNWGDLLSITRDEITSPILVSKDFNHRYNLNVSSEIALSLGRQTMIDSRHELVIHLDDNQVVLRFNKQHTALAASIYRAFKQVLSSIEQIDLASTAWNINILTSQQRNNLENLFPLQAFPNQQVIFSQFEKNAQLHPEKVALVYANTYYSYQKLNEEANQLAHYLRTHHELKPGSIVALYLNKAPELIVAILATLKVACSYLPLDINHATERSQFILADAKPRLLLSTTGVASQLVCGQLSHPIELINLDEDKVRLSIQSMSKQNLELIIDANQLAYIIYTSGTTGHPKGVLQPHANLTRLFSATKDLFSFNSQDVWVLFHSQIFDFSVWEMWGALYYGGCLVIPSLEQNKDFNLFYKLCLEHQVSVLNQTPKAFYEFMQLAQIYFEQNPTQRLDSLRYIIFGGDKLVPSKLKPWLEMHSIDQPKLINMYGISETTVHVTFKQLTVQDIEQNNSNIGRPIPDMQLYILDSKLNPVPHGAVGELYVGGAGLAKGYLNQDELSAARFLANPFQLPQHIINLGYTRIYKTGDLAKLNPNYEIEYIGRNDTQVKLRGYRIELGEIESVLMQMPGIDNAVVILKNLNDENCLIAYYISDAQISQESISSYLLDKIPQYMIPAVLIKLAKIPLTINGKLDLSMLLAEAENHHNQTDSYTAPTTARENIVCKAFATTLAREVVGTNCDFFQLGGHSISVIKLVSLLKKSGLNVSVAEVYKHKTPHNLCWHLVNPEMATDLLNYQAFSLIDKDALPSRLDISDAYPASSLQVGMIFESSLNKDGTYHDVFSYLINLPFDSTKFYHVIDNLFAKFPGLRTGFVPDDKHAYLCLEHQKVETKQKIRIMPESVLEAIIAEEISHGFELSTPGLIRFIVIPQPESFTLILSFHHIIADGLSISLLLSEIIQNYKNQANPQLPPVAEQISYGKYIAQEQLAITNSAHLSFWKTYLANYNFLNLSFNTEEQKLSADPQIETFTELSLDYSAQIIQYCKRNNCTPDNFLLAIFALVIAKFTNTHEVLVGLVANNRLEEEYGDQLFGCFLNTIPLRLSVNTKLNTDFINLVNSVADEKAMIFSHKQYPQAEIKSNILPNKLRLLNFAFNYIHFQTLDQYYAAGTLENRILFEKNSLPLTLHVVLRDNKFVVNFKAEHNFMSADIFQTFSNYFISYLEQTINHKTTAITYQELPQLLSTVNLTNLEEYKFSFNKTLWEEFYCSANNYGDRLAIATPQLSISYAQLVQDSSNIGKYLQENHHGVTLVAIWCEKSYLQIPAVLGILASNKAYLPLNNLWPADMVKEILTFSLVSTLLISQENYHNYGALFKPLQFKLLIIEEVLKTKLDNVALNTFNYSPDSLAYVIFTSGSTGKPKGVAITHRQALNTIYAVKQKFFINSKDSIFAISDLSFDLSLFDIFGALLSGAKLLIPTAEQIHNINDWDYWFATHKITIWNSVPQLFYLLIQNLNAASLASLRLILLSGDTIGQKIVTMAAQALPFAKVVALGGATEGSIWSIWHEINYQEQQNKRYVPYGKSMPNQKIYVLNNDLSHTPIELVGEIYIGGQGVALKYWQDDKLTSQRFITHPQLGKIYRSGDLGIMHIDGVVEIKGRMDKQVKLNGYRVELSEIEYRLSQLPNIMQCCVISEQNTESRQNELIAYICYANLDDALDAIQLKSLLSNKLPTYMIPQHFIQLDSLPITANGKIDRKALPKLQPQHSSKYVAAENLIEQALQSACSELLNINIATISMLDNFFSLGGDSILAIQLAAKLSKQNFQITLKEIYQSNQLLQMAQLIKDRTGPSKPEKSELNKTLPQEFGLLPIQKWFFRQHKLGKIKNCNYWNQSFLIKTPPLAKEKLEVAINELFKRHNQLGVYFKPSTAAWKQINSAKPPLQLTEINASGLSQLELVKLLSDFQSKFEISEPNKPLCCAAYISGYPDNSARIFFAFHHLIVDAVSWRIIIDELFDLYQGVPLLSDVAAVYQEWVAYLSHYGTNFPLGADYWLNLAIESECPTKLVTYPDSSSFEEIILEASQLESLQQINQLYNTRINDLLLTALGYVLAELNQCSSNWVVIEGHGREILNSNLDIFRAVGWFTTLYPVKLTVFKEIATTIKATKEYLRAIPHNGIGYGAISAGYDNLPKISFNYLGQFISRSEEWQLVDENSGVNFDPLNQDIYDININCYIINNRCVFKVLTKYGPEVAQSISDKFKNHLGQIITDCQNGMSKGIYEATASDYSFRLNPQHLSKLFACYPAQQIEEIVLANSLQQGMIYSYLANPKDDSYLIQAVYKYTGELEVSKYEQAWQLLVGNYPSLRSSFDWEEGDIIQIFHTQGLVNFKYLDKSHSRMTAADLDAMLRQDRQINFKLNEPNLFRVHLIRDEANYYLIFSIHHIITDGWSNSILFNQLHTYYTQLLTDRTVELTTDMAPIELYNYTKTDVHSAQFWQTEFKQEVKPNHYLDKVRFNKAENELSLSQLQNFTLSIKGAEYCRLVDFSKNQAITLNSILQYVWHKVIKLQSGDSKTISGIVVSGRTIAVAGIANAVGLFINTLPLIIDWELLENTPLIQQLQYFQDKIVQISLNCTQSLSSLQKGTRLFDSIVAFENYPEIVNPAQFGVDFKLIDIREKFDYPIALIIMDHHSYLDITLKYDEEYISPSTARNLAQKINEYLENILKLKHIENVGDRLQLQQLNILPPQVNYPVNTQAAEKQSRVLELEPTVINNNLAVLKEQIFSIWTVIFNTAEFSYDDDFFKIGGDSILAIRLCMRLMKLGLECNVKDVHRYTTINKLANFLTKNIE